MKKRDYPQRATDTQGRLPCGAAVAARVDPELEGVCFVGHTHSTAVNAILCSQKAEESTAWRLFPEEIVYCGPAPGYVPYSDLGGPLAQAIRTAVESHLERFRERPKVVLMQNHGLPALGSTASEVENITSFAFGAAAIAMDSAFWGHPQGVKNISHLHCRARRRSIGRCRPASGPPRTAATDLVPPRLPLREPVYPSRGARPGPDGCPWLEAAQPYRTHPEK